MKYYKCDICDNQCIGNEYVLPIIYKDKEEFGVAQARKYHLCKGCEKDISGLVSKMYEEAKQETSDADKQWEGGSKWFGQIYSGQSYSDHG